jgi:GNAT superfamily N-acetyltransferase
MKKVRLATPEDIDEILELGRLIHAENAFMPLSEERIRDYAWRGINQNRAIMGLIGPVGAIEAAIYLTVGQFWYTEELHLEELFAFVRPEFRKSDNAKALVEFAKTSAQRLDVPLLIGVIATIRTAAKIRLYERRLGKQSGAYFLLNAEHKDRAA